MPVLSLSLDFEGDLALSLFLVGDRPLSSFPLDFLPGDGSFLGLAELLAFALVCELACGQSSPLGQLPFLAHDLQTPFPGLAFGAGVAVAPLSSP